MEATWEKGAKFQCLAPEGTAITKGRITELIANKLIKMTTYEPLSFENMRNPGFKDNLSDYSETFEFHEQDGKTLLKLSMGNLPLIAQKMGEPLWDKAIALMKEVSEKDN